MSCPVTQSQLQPISVSTLHFLSTNILTTKGRSWKKRELREQERGSAVSLLVNGMPASIFLQLSLISCSTATDFGYTTKLPFAERPVSSIYDGASPLHITHELRQKLIIQRLGYFAFEAMADTVISDGMQRDDDALWNLLEKFDNDLLSLEQNDWSLINRLQLLAMRHNVLCMYFHLTPGHPARKPGVLRAYSTASDLVNTLMNEDTDIEVLTHSPRTTFRMLAMAAQTIFRVLHSSYGVNLNYEAGKALYNSACLCVHQQSVQFRERDQPRRTRDILQELWRFGENDLAMRAEEPVLSIKTRLGASIIYDCLAIWRSRKQGKQLYCLSKAKAATISGVNTPQDLTPQSDFDYLANIGDFDNLVADYLPLPWNLEFNDTDFLY